MKRLHAFGKILLTVLACAAAFAPSTLLACAACYGRSDSALAEGMNWGIFTLLGVVLTVLTCILVFFVHIVRKEEKANSNPAPIDPPQL
jgi:heme/copper-type cytochrome/quinol oxidase subunit 2